jgi:hypothetical protein
VRASITSVAFPHLPGGVLTSDSCQQLVYRGCGRCQREVVPDRNGVYVCAACPLLKDVAEVGSDLNLSWFYRPFTLELLDSLNGHTEVLSGVTVQDAAASALLLNIPARGVAAQAGMFVGPAADTAREKCNSIKLNDLVQWVKCLSQLSPSGRRAAFDLDVTCRTR